MNPPTVQQATIPREEIARTAWQMWEREGCPQGRDQDYWFRAEQQVLAARQQAENEMINAGAKRKISPKKAKNPARVWPDVTD